LGKCAESIITSCGLGIFVDQAAEPVAASESQVGQ
jgi:hypothetical protein